jgi:DNA-binding CsgD family transcriptional regulator
MDEKELMKSAWFVELLAEVRDALDRQSADERDQAPGLRQELEELRKQTLGWRQSLAKPDLTAALRAVIEQDCGQALQRQRKIEELLAELDVHSRQDRLHVDPQQVVERLERLAEVLASDNPTRGNLELSLHIDQIRCFADGKVVVRTCKLGALAGATALLAGPDAQAAAPPTAPEDGVAKATPRRRALLQVDASGAEARQLRAAAATAADVGRFAELASHWFWEDVYQIPGRTCWAAEHAAEVARLRAGGLTLEKLAEHFDKTIPTIRKALRMAAESDETVRSLPRKMPRPCWAKENAAEAARLKTEGLSVPQIARRLSKSEPTIRAALKWAARLAEERGATPPVGEDEGQDGHPRPADFNQPTDSSDS